MRSRSKIKMTEDHLIDLDHRQDQRSRSKIDYRNLYFSSTQELSHWSKLFLMTKGNYLMENTKFENFIKGSKKFSSHKQLIATL